jgi:hypothetical protein
MKEGLFNHVLCEYLRTTGHQWRYWDNSEYEFCIHLMNELSIGARRITPTKWEAECGNWGIGRGGNVMESVFNCFLGFSQFIVDAEGVV